MGMPHDNYSLASTDLNKLKEDVDSLGGALLAVVQGQS
jgi:hypothetical protein